MLNIPSPLKEQNASWLSQPTPGHSVQFYAFEKQLISNLSEYIGTGLRKGDNCVIVAKASHVNGVTGELEKQGFDVPHFTATGQLNILDAKETLSKFMVDGLPDKNLFFSEIGTLVDNTLKHGKPLRAYGEMVALLWQAGNEEAVMQLEGLWNDIGNTQSFSLFCAYPRLQFILDAEAQDKISHCHDLRLSSVIS